MDNRLLSSLTRVDIGEIADAIRESKDVEPNKLGDIVLEKLRKNSVGYKPLCRDRYKEILPIVETVVGQKYEDNRKFDNVLIKCLISNRLRNEGYTLYEIGKAMNKDHSTIQFYINKMNDMACLPNMFYREVRMKSLYDYAIEEYDKAKNQV